MGIGFLNCHLLGECFFSSLRAVRRGNPWSIVPFLLDYHVASLLIMTGGDEKA